LSVEANPRPDVARKNYVYGLPFRLVKSGKLVKRGSKYRAAPISSPQGEAEAVGPPLVNQRVEKV
jgi:hypothetical protein